MNLANMKRSETTEQIGLINWARANEEYVPELRLLHHIPNEGIRTNGPVLKAAGMKAGVPDLSLPVPRRGFHGLYIEMKFGKGKTTKAQEEFMALLREQGYKTAVAYGAEQAREVIRHYLARGEGFDLVNCEHAFKMCGYCEESKKGRHAAPKEIIKSLRHRGSRTGRLRSFNRKQVRPHETRRQLYSDRGNKGESKRNQGKEGDGLKTGQKLPPFPFIIFIKERW